MLRYFATFTDPRLLGKTKLMKLFYFTDFGHVKKYASPITCDNYVHLEHGPIPSTIMNFVNAVENDTESAILGDTIQIERREGSNMKRIVALRDFTPKDSEYFSQTELKTMESVCKRFKGFTGKEIEDISHKEGAFLKTEEGESIPYVLAAEDQDCLIGRKELESLLSLTQC